jgi:hypothetical protein
VGCCDDDIPQLRDNLIALRVHNRQVKTNGGMRSIGDKILECYNSRMNVMIDGTRRNERMISTPYKGNKEKSLYKNRTLKGIMSMIEEA